MPELGWEAEEFPVLFIRDTIDKMSLKRGWQSTLKIKSDSTRLQQSEYEMENAVQSVINAA